MPWRRCSPTTLRERHWARPLGLRRSSGTRSSAPYSTPSRCTSACAHRAACVRARPRERGAPRPDRSGRSPASFAGIVPWHRSPASFPGIVRRPLCPHHASRYSVALMATQESSPRIDRDRAELRERLREATELLERVAADRGLLADLASAERPPLLHAAGSVVHPDTPERRRLG